MSARRKDLLAEPWRADILALMRELERGNPKKPRIGTSEVLAQEVVALGQDPFVEFPNSNITAIEERPDRPLRVRARFLGHFGPQGSLPLATTAEALAWHIGNDNSFTSFADIFATRFLQLFFRAWSDARPITQMDRPELDRFRDYVGSFIGLGTPAFHDRDHVPDVAKLPYAGVMAGRVKSAARLRQVLEGVLGLDVEVVERVGNWLEFEAGDLSRLGQAGSSLGQNTYLGARVYSVETKALLRVRTRSLEDYESFLPGGRRFQELADTLRLYLGETVDFDVALGLPRACVPDTIMGKAGRLGWTTWASPKRGDASDEGDDAYLFDALFSVAQADNQISQSP